MFFANNKTQPFTYSMTGTSAVTSIAKTYGVGVWEFNKEIIKSSNYPTYSITGSGTTHSVKLYSDSFDKITSLKINNVVDNINLSSFKKLSTLIIDTSTAGSCYGLTSITNPSTSVLLSSYTVSNCGLKNINLSTLSGFGGAFYIYNNFNLSSITNPVSSNAISHYEAYNCNLSNLNLSGLTGLGGVFNVNQNKSLSSITNPISSTVFTQYDASSCGLQGTLILSGLSRLGGSLLLNSNANLTNVVFPITTETFSMIKINGCNNVGYVNMNPLSGSSSNYVNVYFENNAWTSSIVNHMLYDLDHIGWYFGTLYIAGTNFSPNTSSGGYNGTAAKANLISKGWTVYSN